MLIPLGTDRPLRRRTRITPLLIIACGLVYMVQMALDGPPAAGLPVFTSRFWIEGGGVVGPLRLFTYQFLHGGLLHLLGNMLFLWVFGRAVEDKLGRVGFTAFYLLGGAFAGLMHTLFEPAPAVGASGSIAAVTGAFLVLFPRTRIKVLWFFILITMMQAPAWFFIGLQIAWNLLAQVSGRADNVAVLAHLAGYAFGFVVALVLLWTGVLSREPYDLFTISRQAKRRREFRTLSRVEAKPSPRIAQPARDRRPGRPDRTEAIAKARAAVSTEISRGRPEAAVAPYRHLITEHGSDPAAVTLARNGQYQLALQLYNAGEIDLAIRALGDFIRVYAADRETPQIKILLGRLLTDAGQTDRARDVLTDARESVDDEELKQLADAELARIGGDGDRDT